MARRGALSLLVLLLGSDATTSTPPAVPEDVPTTVYVNGHWWDGSRFVDQTVHVIGDAFAARMPGRIDQEIDLDGAWVVPPFAEAHNHHFDAPWMMEAINERLLREGVFYAMSMTNWVDGKQDALPFWGRRETVDVAFADLGLTASYGHPVLIYENLARNQFDFDATAVHLFHERQAEGRAYLLFDSPDDVAEKWSQVMASRPDLLKIYLLRTERWEELARDETRLGHRGLHPDVAAAIVDRARSEGLRVAAHVETAHDFRLALDIGVDIIAHLPGYSLSFDPTRDTTVYRISEADAARAAELGTVVIPTPLAPQSETAIPDHAKAFHAGQLRRMRDAGVVLAVGSDHYSGTPLTEILFLHELGVFSNAELLEMWGRQSAETIFPERNLGRLEAGYEASFIGLDCSPVDDFQCVERIRVRVNRGKWLGGD